MNKQQTNVILEQVAKMSAFLSVINEKLLIKTFKQNSYLKIKVMQNYTSIRYLKLTESEEHGGGSEVRKR